MCSGFLAIYIAVFGNILDCICSQKQIRWKRNRNFVFLAAAMSSAAVVIDSVSLSAANAFKFQRIGQNRLNLDVSRTFATSMMSASLSVAAASQHAFSLQETRLTCHVTWETWLTRETWLPL